VLGVCGFLPIVENDRVKKVLFKDVRCFDEEVGICHSVEIRWALRLIHVSCY
jgi:hypothetical protein